MDEESEVAEFPSVGERLRSAREEKGFSLEDIAAETRIPLRHLESLEAGDWERLPAPTYTIGFAKNYAGSVGLDRAEIGEQLRTEMGGYRADTAVVEHFEPVDPARAMPKWLVFGAIAAVLLVVLVFTWIRNQSLTQEAPPTPAATEAPAPQQAQQQAAPQQQATPQGPVVIAATAPAWIRVTDQGKTLYEGVLQPGQTFPVPPTAIAPMLRAGAPEAIRINVGQALAPPVGPAGQVTSNISLKPEDLMRGPQANLPQQPASPPQNTLAQ
jgi:cytoskeletal protein RodZ